VYRRFVWRRFVEETFCRGDVLYVRRLFEMLKLSRVIFFFKNNFCVFIFNY
jgi:hypothetical protein